MDINALKESCYFILYYPEKIVSSVAFQAWIPLAIGKPTFYFSSMKYLIFLMQKANPLNFLQIPRSHLHANRLSDRLNLNLHPEKKKFIISKWMNRSMKRLTPVQELYSLNRVVKNIVKNYVTKCLFKIPFEVIES